jgi:hypothetical protein
MRIPWIETTREALLNLRTPAAGWGYRPGTMPSAEPTALACMGLLAAQDAAADGDRPAGIVQSADWLGSLQRTDGGLGVAAAVASPAWTTPHALLLWSALDGYEAERARAVRWLLGQKGLAIPNLAARKRGIGHDTSLAGWPWIDGTHSWLEPTALAVLVLRANGHGHHSRVAEGLCLIRDRAIAGGGWNYGNRAAFGHDLRPQPGPTGLALLALAGTDAPERFVASSIAYLSGTLQRTRAPMSLCWGLLGLRAWERMPPAAADWLHDASAEVLRREPDSLRLAHLLLAVGPRSLELFGVEPEKGNRHA